MFLMLLDLLQNVGTTFMYCTHNINMLKAWYIMTCLNFAF